ncbi:unnamed protein product [Tuwongella immobilis]|uniref:Uncharacterized protein n=1 Tax=Tuwongella immobilis TaxID=692036 RepID=A0A6C2YRR0_9BACT|nr:unnamed protein product [Tuwongella immobilis]VTS05415.1 unnamed protein product [Tuwongella immobilis]
MRKISLRKMLSLVLILFGIALMVILSWVDTSVFPPTKRVMSDGEMGNFQLVVSGRFSALKSSQLPFLSQVCQDWVTIPT